MQGRQKTACNTYFEVSSKMSLCLYDTPYINNKTSGSACDESVAACEDIDNNNVLCGNDKLSTEYDARRDTEKFPIVSNQRNITRSLSFKR